MYNGIMLPSRILAPFRRLRWKLTLSYTLATAGSVLALEVLALLALIVLFSSPRVQMQLVQEAAVGLAADAQPFLSVDLPDQAGLHAWLRQTVPPQMAPGSGPSFDVDADLGAAGRQTSLTFGENDAMAVVGPAGEALATSAKLPSAGAGSGASFNDPAAPGESRQIVDRALRGAPAGTRLPDRTILAAQPVAGEDGQVLGAVYLRIASFGFLARNVLGGALGFLGGSALVLMLGAGIVGTFFGLFVAHGFERRLGTLAGATEAWGRGDFSAAIHDASPDEIGQLGRRLNLMAEEIQDLLQARQDLATLEERNRLARDLHDSVKQQVFATTMTLGAAESLWERDPEAARQKVAQALALCRQAQQELSGLIHELRPAALEGKGLPAALREYTTRWSRQTGIEAIVAAQAERTLPPELEQALFRVAQEALANVAKHSQAKRAEVMLSCPGDAVLLEVADDGLGFAPPPSAGRGMGLRSMRERTEALGGELVVSSEPGVGTRVAALCKIEAAPAGGDRA